MNYIILDLLDLASIKTKKFRKSIKPFNIRQTIIEVIGMQKLKAID